MRRGAVHIVRAVHVVRVHIVRAVHVMRAL
jgi:hypothetical protein